MDLNLNKHYNNHLQNAWNKYGKNSFKFEIFYLCPPQDLNYAEMFFIDKLDSFNKNKGYNMTLGGEGLHGHKHSEETKRKMSESQLGIKNHRYGKKISEEHRISLVKFFTGKKASSETCKKIGLIHRGKVLSEETKRKISEATIGRIVSEESKIGTANSWKNGKLKDRKKPVVQKDINGNVIGEYESAREAMRKTSIPSGNISSCCNKKGLKSAGGFIWGFVTK